MTSALNIARFITQTCIDLHKPTTNMKLQKLLYYSWIYYYKETKGSGGSGKYLFQDPISAWKFGPVIPSVYHEYSIFAGMPISFTDPPNEQISDDDKKFLKSMIDKFDNVTATQMMRLTHKEGSPWNEVYNPIFNCRIPFDLIIEKECK